MAETLTPSALADRLAAQRREDEEALAADRRALQAAAQRELESFGSELRAFARDEARRIRSAMADELAVLDRLRRGRWRWPVLTGLLTVAGLAAGAWGLATFLSLNVQRSLHTAQQLEARIAEQRRTLEALREQAWNVELREMTNGRFVVLPPDAETGPDERLETRWRIEGRPAVRLAAD